ncbi:hypothetical protein [Dapis sp. BLCC M172]|uniref:hypothetical protein n=1 Tax=Dapis sp. BLCC M172 TaxID=2975281 RepID=UPI003CF8ECF4
MTIGPNSPSVRIFLGEEDRELRNKFKQLVAVAGTSMSKRLTLFMEKDVAYWEATGEILDVEVLDLDRSEKLGKLDRLDELMEKLNYLVNILQPETNGHHVPKQVKVVKPRKHHKTYKGKVGELVTELPGNQVKVSFDGEEKAFYRDELELVETE